MNVRRTWNGITKNYLEKSFTYIADHLTTITESMYGKPELKSDRLSIYEVRT